MKKTYQLSFDPYKTDAEQLHEVIKNSELIENWAHYLLSFYLFVSENSLKDINHEIKEKWPNQDYFISEIDPKNVSGWLPKDAWTWIDEST